MSSAGMGVSAHMLGNRHYELPNHLGNVQATVLDRVTPTLDQSNALTGYRSDMSLAHDYYPFGQLMSGRYVSDTSGKCVTVSTTVLVPRVTKVWNRPIAVPNPGPIVPKQWTGSNTTQPGKLQKASNFSNSQLFVYHYNPLSMHTNGRIGVADTTSEGEMRYTIDQDNEPSGLTMFMQIHADTNQENQEFGFTLQLNDSTTAEWCVRQYSDSTGESYSNAVSWQSVTNSGIQSVQIPINKAAVTAGGITLLQLRLSAVSGNAKLNGSTIALLPYTYVTTWVPETRLARICDDKDNYRFGFNGQEKVNEIAGIGNHLTAEFWEYDTRIGRRWNTDPIVKPWESSYAAFNNNPIWKLDPNGDDALVKTDKDKGTIDVSTTVYVAGGDDKDRKDFVDNANKFVGDMEGWGNMSGTYKDEDGREWKITLHVKYVDGGKKSGRKLGEGENEMDISKIYQGGVSKVSGGDNYDSKTKTWDYNRNGTSATIRGPGAINYGFRPFHETLHFMGLSDRYDNDGRDAKDVHKGYEADMMSERGTKMHQSHWDNWGRAALKVGSDFTLKNRVDITGDQNMKYLQPGNKETKRGTR